MKQVARLVVTLIPLLLVVGCGSKVGAPEGEAGTAVKGGAPAVEAGAPGTGAEAERLAPEDGRAAEEAARAEQADEAASEAEKFAALLKERKIYFDFDRSEIRPEFRDIIVAHGKYLADNPTASVTIEGHADERGTREYNMALGERRAHSVLRMLSLNGASRDQMKTVSFGEERPEVEGHDESAWKWNRRAVFIYAD